MDPRLQNARGRIKEAAGALTGNQRLKSDGAADQVAAKAAQRVQELAKGAKGIVNNSAETVKGAIDNAADKLKP